MAFDTIQVRDKEIANLKANDKSNLDLCEQAADEINKLRKALRDSEIQIAKCENDAQDQMEKIKKT